MTTAAFARVPEGVASTPLWTSRPYARSAAFVPQSRHRGEDARWKTNLRAEEWRPGGDAAYTELSTSLYAGTGTKMETGYTYGGGIEYALPVDSIFNVLKSSAVTVKAEFLHYELGTSTLLIPNTGAIGAGVYTQRIRVDGNLVRAGLNFKFGAPDAAPVVARY